MKILGIIPARSGSVGVPGKNSKILGTKPLLQYTTEAATRSALLTDTIISTDSEIIASIAKNCGVKAPFIRPAELATNTAASIDVVIHAIKFLENEGRFYDAVCLLQPTAPFRRAGFIDKAISKFKEMDADTLISVLPLPTEYNPHWAFVPTEDGSLKIATGDKEIIKRRQDLPPAYFRDGSIYLTKTSVIKLQHTFYGNRITYLESDPVLYVNIDNPVDWRNAENKLPTVLPLLECAE